MIELEGVHKSFDRPVLTGIDLKIPRGCLYGLVGPGASGKSLLLKLISGLLRADRGQVRVDGEDLGRQSELELARFRQNVGMLFQNNALFDFMSVGDNVGFPLRRRYQLPELEIEARVAERLARVGLAGFEKLPPSALSGGQRKRVGIARATIASASIVLYDEPAAGLDPVTSQRIFDLLRAEQRLSAATVVMVSSDVERLVSVTDRLGMMVDGRLVFDGTTRAALECDQPVVRQFLQGLEEGPL